MINSHIIKSQSSLCRTKDGGTEICLNKDVIGFFHGNYYGGGNWKISGTIENLICTFKNDITRYSDQVLTDASDRLTQILSSDFQEILTFCQECGLDNLRVCVIPRSKAEPRYRPDQLLFRSTIKNTIKAFSNLEDGTMDIIRIIDTATTHLSKSGYAGYGEMPYVGITAETCSISDSVVGKDILLIDDLYTKTVNIDEDCIQALLDKGAKRVIFYSIGYTQFKN